MPKIPKHILIDHTKKPAEFVCELCGATRPVHFPAAISDFTKQAEALGASHKWCKVTRTAPQADGPKEE